MKELDDRTSWLWGWTHAWLLAELCSILHLRGCWREGKGVCDVRLNWCRVIFKEGCKKEDLLSCSLKYHWNSKWRLQIEMSLVDNCGLTYSLINLLFCKPRPKCFKTLYLRFYFIHLCTLSRRRRSILKTASASRLRTVPPFLSVST